MKKAAHSKEIIFITGITGFTGKHLEKYLQAKGFIVYGTTSSLPNYPNHFQCNILYEEQLYEILNKIKPDYIIHLAAISFVAAEDQNAIYNVNVFGSLNLLNAVKRLDYTLKKVLLSSSAAVYGNVEGALDETLCPQPVNHYGNSKLVMENMSRNYFSDLNIIISRPFNYTGIGQEPHFLIPKIVSHFKEGKKVIELGNTEVYREFNNVEFVAECYHRLIISEIKSEIINVCSGKAYSINDILNFMSEIAGYKIDVKINPDFVRKNEIKVLKGDLTKLKSYIEIEDKNNLKYNLSIMYSNC